MQTIDHLNGSRFITARERRNSGRKFDPQYQAEASDSFDDRGELFRDFEQFGFQVVTGISHIFDQLLALDHFHDSQRNGAG